MREVPQSELSANLNNRSDTLPPGERPIWMATWDIEDPKVKLSLTEQTKNVHEVTVVSKLHNPKYYETFCEEMATKHQKWTYYADANEIIGTETSCLILIGISLLQNWEALI